MGGPDEWDRGTIYPVGLEATIEGKSALDYNGNNLGHVREVGKPGIGLALMHEGGFAGWRADEAGVLTTQLLSVRYVQDWLYVNAEASGGTVEAELLDPAGRVIPGFSRRDFQPVREDGAMLLVRWNDMKALEEVLARGRSGCAFMSSARPSKEFSASCGRKRRGRCSSLPWLGPVYSGRTPGRTLPRLRIFDEMLCFRLHVAADDGGPRQ